MLVSLDMRECLVEIGFESFAFAGTEAQALEQARLKRPDLVTVDVRLLHGDGRVVAGVLQQEFGEMAVIYVTGDPKSVSTEPNAAVVEKPFGRTQLEAACRRLRLH